MHFTRFFEDMLARVDGPLHLRLIAQPLMALIFGVRAGLRDARAGAAPYFWTIVQDPARRRTLLIQGWVDVGKIFIIAMVVDSIYQIIAIRWIYPGESAVVATMLAFVPYYVFRGVSGRIRVSCVKGKRQR
jgi:hypothetical protein